MTVQQNQVPMTLILVPPGKQHDWINECKLCLKNSKVYNLLLSFFNIHRPLPFLKKKIFPTLKNVV